MASSKTALFVPLAALDEPPEGYEFPYKSSANGVHGWRVSEWKAIVQYHGYGFAFESQTKKAELCNIFRKISYHTSGGRTPACVGDVGPGTLNNDIKTKLDLPDWTVAEADARSYFRSAQHLYVLPSAAKKPKDKPRWVCPKRGVPVITCPNFDVAIKQEQEQEQEQAKNASAGSPGVAQASLRQDVRPSLGAFDTQSILVNQPQGDRLHEDIDHQQEHSEQQHEHEPPVLSKNEIRDIAETITHPPVSGEPSALKAGPETINQPATSNEVINLDDSDNVTEPNGPDLFPVPLPAVTPQWYEEMIERTLFDGAYFGLSRHEAAFPLTPKPFLTATSTSHLRSAISSNSPAAAYASLVQGAGNETRFAIKPSGKICRYYGRGPVWDNNSCFWDTLIVAALCLHAGCTRADRGGSTNWEQSLDDLDKAFLDALSLDWNHFDHATSVAQKNQFLDFYTIAYNKQYPSPQFLTSGKFGSPVQHWNEVTKHFHQFRFLTQVQSGCACSPGRLFEHNPNWVRYLTPRVAKEDKTNSTTMQTLIRRCFKDVLPCRRCNKTTRSRRHVVIGDLPLRLVVQLDPQSPIPDRHTDNIQFSYDKIHTGGQGQSIEPYEATYRWLGGVYYNKKRNHFRLYWTDQTRGEADRNTIRIYDGMEADGAIVGSLKLSTDKANKVKDPDWFSRSDPPPLLFYERVFNPSPEAIAKANETLKKMQTAITQQNLILEHHTPWKIGLAHQWNPRHNDTFERALQPHILQGVDFRASVIPGLDDTPTPPPKATTSSAIGAPSFGRIGPAQSSTVNPSQARGKRAHSMVDSSEGGRSLKRVETEVIEIDSD